MPNAGSTPTDVAFVQIGAMLVGTIVPTKAQSAFVKRGEELGYFGTSPYSFLLEGSLPQLTS